jgi:uncharacterized protein YbbK (DUF523 family)/uncharacterized protein YbgA (DUF1722 family)
VRTGSALRVGVSACLLGQEVRYDGGHRRDRWLTDALGRFAEFVPVCPEVEIGLGVPRPTIRLEDRGGGGGVRLVEPAGGVDLTDRMARFSAKRAAALGRADLSGFVLKSKSPSCGLAGVEVRRPHGGAPRRDGRGLFAAALVARHPHLPVEEEGRLADPSLRERFVVRLFAHRRLRDLLRGRRSARALAEFHARERLLLLAHAPRECAALDRIVAGAADRPRGEVAARYGAGFLGALAHPDTPARHRAVLRRAASLVRDRLGDAERAALGRAIDGFAEGRLPRAVPLDLLRRHAARLRVAGLAGQSYLEPHPRGLLEDRRA